MSNDTSYTIVVRDFADKTNWGLGDTIAFIENALNVAWTDYINDVGEAFFSLSQDDPVVQLLAPYVDFMPHVQIYRNGDDLVWAGWLGEMDETPDDVIVYAYNYNSGLYMLHSDWNQEWENEEVSQIIEDLWDRATDGTLTKSRMSWMTKGTIEDLVTTSDGATVLELPLYRLYYKRILTAFQELAAYAISDTTNKVKFNISPHGIFRLYKDFGDNISDVRFSYENGAIRNYRRLRVPVDSRTVLLGVGSSPTSLILRDTETSTTPFNNKGRLEEALYFPWVKNSNELDRVLKARKHRAARVDTDLFLTFHSGALTPFGATGESYKIGDSVDIYLPRGLSKTDAAETKIITGHQVVWYRNSENVRLLLADNL